MSGQVETARIAAASAIVSNARVEAACIITRAESQADSIIRRAHIHANRIETSAREYAATLAPNRPTSDPTLYQTLMKERYGLRKKGGG